MMTTIRHHPLIYVMSASPINRQAAMVTSQSGCDENDKPLTKLEIVHLVDRLKRKHRLLKMVLGIKTKAQHRNLMYKYNKRLPQYRQRDEPRAFTEYIRVGRDIQRLVIELTELKTIRRFVAASYPNRKTA